MRSGSRERAAAFFLPVEATARPGERDAAEIDSSWWKRRERVKQQHLPRLQLYAFDTTQANQELYMFLYDREDVRHFYVQSRRNGERMGEIEAVPGRGRQDIMAIAWRRKGGADFEVILYGHMNLQLAEGYIIKSDVQGKYTWVIKLTRLYGEHVMSLTSQTLLSLPVYTALASGLKEGLEDPIANDYLGFNENVAEKVPTAEPVQAPLPEASVEAGMEELNITDVKLPPSAAPPGRCETGSFFSTQQSLAASRGEKSTRGDKWTIVRPWDNNASIGSVASFERYIPSGSEVGLGMRCSPQVSDAPIGIIFPTRGTPVASMGKFVNLIDIESIPIISALGLEATNAMSAYRAYLYNTDIDIMVGIADIIPDARRNADGKSMTSKRYLATPSKGKTWVGAGTDPIIIDATDIKRCKDGDVCPWSIDLVCVIESAIHKIEMDRR